MKQEELLNNAIDNMPKGFLLQYEIDDGHDLYDGRGKLKWPREETATFSLKVQHIHRKESLMSFREKTSLYPTNNPVLLVCNRLTPTLAEYCVNNKINFIDSSGNAYIQISGLYLFIEGRYQKHPVAISSHFTEGVMKLLFILLSYPESLNDPYRRLAEKANISLGMVSKAFDFLEVHRYLRKSQKQRRLMNKSELQIFWLKDYATVLRSKLDFLALPIPDSRSEITLTNDECWSGEIIAEKLSDGYLVPESGVIFTPHSLLKRQKELGLKPVPGGKLQLVSCFWRNVILNDQAEAMLCVAELLASKDDRNREVARMLNDKYLHLSESSLFSY